MIKSKDLKIGDLVMVGNDNCLIPKGALCEVVAIDSEWVCEDKHMALVALCQEPRQRKRSVWTNTARRCRAYTLHPSVSLQSTSRQWRTSLPKR